MPGHSRLRKQKETLVAPTSPPTFSIAMVPLAELLRAPRNPKDHDIPTLTASMARFGFTQPLTVDERTGRIVEGHGRLDTLQQIKLNNGPVPLRVQVKGSEWLVPVLRGISFASDAEAEAYLITANQSVIAGGWNDAMLADMITSFAANNMDTATLGFDSTVITDLLANYQSANAGDSLAGLTATPPAPSAAPAPSTAPTPVAVTAPPLPTPSAAGPAGAPAPSTPTPAGVGAAPPPPPPAHVPLGPNLTAPTGPVALSPTVTLQPSQDGDASAGILDPIDRTLMRTEYQVAGQVLRFMRYSIPIIPEESARLEAAMEKWINDTGGVFGFVLDLLNKAGY